MKFTSGIPDIDNNMIEYLAVRLAQASNEIQAKFLNSFGEHLCIACGEKEPMHDAEMQLCYIQKDLNKHGKQLVEALAGFIELAKGD